MEDIYKLLVKFFGKPPNNFDWEYVDKKNKYKIIKKSNTRKIYKNDKNRFIRLCMFN